MDASTHDSNRAEAGSSLAWNHTGRQPSGIPDPTEGLAWDRSERQRGMLCGTPTLSWDGSDLGDISTWPLQEIGQVQANSGLETYYQLGRDFFIIRNFYTKDPLVIDELKELFGLRKLGTHYAKYREGSRKIFRKILLIRVPQVPFGEDLESWDRVWGQRLDWILGTQIRRTLLFRELLGVGRTCPPSLRIYERGLQPEVVSLYEPNLRPELGGSTLSSSTRKRWFSQVQPSDELRTMLGIKDDQDLLPVTLRLRTELERVINRVDRDSIYHVSAIIQRLMVQAMN